MATSIRKILCYCTTLLSPVEIKFQSLCKSKPFLYLYMIKLKIVSILKQRFLLCG